MVRVPIHGKTVSAIAMADTSSGFSILADVLIPGRGEPISKAALVVKDEVIEWVGPEDDLPGRYSSLGSYRVPVLMPYVLPNALTSPRIYSYCPRITWTLQ